MILNCLIVDDEPLARQQIETYINRVPFLKLAGLARNATTARGILDSTPIDLIFLDIKMPQMSGIEFLRQNHIFQQIIFITAYPEYAIEGFELEVTDYLMKPVPFDRFVKAAEKALAKVSGFETIKAVDHQSDFIYIKHKQRYEKVPVADLLYVESMLNYVNIITIKGKFTVYSSLKKIETGFPANKLIRIHKSYLVSVDAITTIEQRYLFVGELKLPISRSNRKKVAELVTVATQQQML